MTYLVTGTYRKKGKTFPFRKMVEGTDQSQAEHELRRWLRASKMKVHTSTFRPLESAPESETKREVAVAEARGGSMDLGETMWRHVREQGWPGFQDAVKALIGVCERIQASPLQTDQIKASALCRKLEELPVAA